MIVDIIDLLERVSKLVRFFLSPFRHPPVPVPDTLSFNSGIDKKRKHCSPDEFFWALFTKTIDWIDVLAFISSHSRIAETLNGVRS